ncbi:MAG: hypothetical protein R3F16_13725 [Myxococcota bacterium]
MADHVVDTNVLIVASAAVEPKYTDVNVDANGIDVVCSWLTRFRDDAARRLVIDEVWEIYKEYNHKLNAQHFGLQVVHHKLQACLRTEPVEYDGNGYGVVPAALADMDNSDKKFVAAALNDPANIEIVYAVDRGWKRNHAALQAHSVVVVGLLS